MHRRELSQHQAVYPHPNPFRSGRSILANPAGALLLDPPEPDEGHLTRVDMDYVASGRRDAFVRCQQCGQSVERTEPHVSAVVVLKPNGVRRFHNQKFVHFSDQACWGQWASRSRLPSTD